MSRVLIVDDDVQLLERLARFLARWGTVDTAEGRQQARRWVARHRYEVVVMDLAVGRDDGVDIVRQLVAEQPRAVPAVVFHTGLRPTPLAPLEVDVSHVVVAKGDMQGLVDAVAARLRPTSRSRC